MDAMILHPNESSIRKRDRNPNWGFLCRFCGCRLVNLIEDVIRKEPAIIRVRFFSSISKFD